MTFHSSHEGHPKRHTYLHAAGATFARSDPELINRVLKERKRLFNQEELPEHMRYTAEEYDRADDN